MNKEKVVIKQAKEVCELLRIKNDLNTHKPQVSEN